MTLAQLKADSKTASAISYALTVLGEAANGVSQSTQDGAPTIPWKQMRGLRNFVTHEYFRVDLGILHAIVSGDLNHLIPEIRTLLRDC